MSSFLKCREKNFETNIKEIKMSEPNTVIKMLLTLIIIFWILILNLSNTDFLSNSRNCVDYKDPHYFLHEANLLPVTDQPSPFISHPISPPP